jgi:hypothetical protein
MKKQNIQMMATVSDHLLHIQPLHTRQGTAPDPAETLDAKILGPVKNTMYRNPRSPTQHPSAPAYIPGNEMHDITYKDS